MCEVYSERGCKLRIKTMAKVNAINSNNQNPYSIFGSLAKGTAGGAMLGLVAKYALPLDAKELSETDRLYIDIIREQSKRAKSIPIEAIRNLEEKTPAQDVFLKMIDAQTNSEKSYENAYRRFSQLANGVEGYKKGNKTIDIREMTKEMRKIIKESHLDVKGKEELKNIISQVNKTASDLSKRHVKTHVKAIKMDKRPAIAYMTIGGVVGFISTLAHKFFAGQ